MFGTKMKYAFFVLMLFAIVGLAGCILSPDVEKPQPKPKPTYKDLTAPEDVISNLVQSYNEHNLARYTELLHLEYIWYNQAADVGDGLPEYNNRDKEIDQHEKMFRAADHNYTEDPLLNLDRLSLSIDGEVRWDPITELEGNPCADCWQTTREYFITAEVIGGATTYIGNDLATFTVVGVPKDGVTYYRLRRIDDIKKP